MDWNEKWHARPDFWTRTSDLRLRGPTVRTQHESCNLFSPEEGQSSTCDRSSCNTSGEIILYRLHHRFRTFSTEFYVDLRSPLQLKDLRSHVKSFRLGLVLSSGPQLQARKLCGDRRDEVWGRMLSTARPQPALDGLYISRNQKAAAANIHNRAQELPQCGSARSATGTRLCTDHGRRRRRALKRSHDFLTIDQSIGRSIGPAPKLAKNPDVKKVGPPYVLCPLYGAMRCTHSASTQHTWCPKRACIHAPPGRKFVPGATVRMVSKI